MSTKLTDPLSADSKSTEASSSSSWFNASQLKNLSGTLSSLTQTILDEVVPEPSTTKTAELKALSANQAGDSKALHKANSEHQFTVSVDWQQLQDENRQLKGFCALYLGKHIVYNLAFV